MHLSLKTQLAVFATWWVCLWGLIAVGDIIAIFLIPFRWWFLLAFITFGTCEGIGLFAKDPSLPPLTDVIRRYVPMWCAFMLIFAFWGGGFYTWDHRIHLVPTILMFGLLGWFTAHFVKRYSQP